ncbi:MAG: phosphoenolpyruvate mutase, partial [Gammaproteobacteria bacterium]|nr:phosphoenolpyruvate mutase [Gammaproteobacteria bacterium]
PDIEAVDMTSRMSTVNDIFEVTTKPMLFDADTGGRPEHFAFTVRSLERLAVSAVVIEDKVGLKKNSLFGTEVEQTQDSIAGFSEKIRAGKAAQISDDFMIVARIESLVLEKGMEDALARAQAYAEAGADGILIHSRRKEPQEVLDFCQEFSAGAAARPPIFVVPSSYNTVHERELADAGANVVIYANQMLRAAYPAMRTVASAILEHGRAFEAEPHCMSIKSILELIPGGR